MIHLEKISVKQPELDLIASWRNQTIISLRSNDLTAFGVSQKDWVDSLDESEKYYFIYNVNEEFPNDLRDAVFLGYCGLDKIDPVSRTAELSLLINPEHHGKGCGAKVTELLLKMAFENFNLNCVFIEVLNTTSAPLFWEKQGFKSEGILRARYYKNGQYYSSLSASILRSEWEKIND